MSHAAPLAHVRDWARVDRHALVLGLIIATLTVAAIPIAMQDLVPDETQLHVEWGSYAVCALSGGRMAWIIAARQIRVYEMIVWLFTYVFFGVATFVQLRTITSPITTTGIEVEFIPEAFAIILLGSLAFLAGVLVGESAPAPLPSRRRTISGRRLLIVSSVALLSGIVLTMRMGGPATLFMTRFQRDKLQGKDEGIPINVFLQCFATFGLVVSVVGAIQWWRERSTAQRRRWHVAVPALLALALFVQVNPIAAPRYYLGACVLGVAGALGMWATPRRFRALTIAALLGLTLVFPMLDSFRVTMSKGVKKFEPLKALTGPDFDSFAQIVNTVEFVKIEGLTWGYQLLGAFAAWAPRKLWPDKPYDTGILLGQYKHYKMKNLSSPLWGEFFIDGGWVWLLLGMALLGLWIAVADRRIHYAYATKAFPGILACLLPFYLLIIMRGSLLQAFANLSVIVVTTWILYSPPTKSKVTK